MTYLIAGILLILGGAFTLVAGIGIYRMQDVFIRMHASTKVGTLGSGLIMAGAAVYFHEPLVVFKAGLVVVFLILSAPIGAHMIGRAALRTGIKPWGVATNEGKHPQDEVVR